MGLFIGVCAVRTAISWLILFPVACWCAVLAAAEPQKVKLVAVSDIDIGFCDFYMLAQRAVQDDLKLSDAQTQGIRQLVQDLVEAQREVFQRKGLDTAEKKFEERLKILRGIEGTALALLKPEQLTRLKQVSFHYRASSSFWDHQVRAKLNITDEQFKKMKAVLNDTGDWRKADEDFMTDKDFPAYQKKAREA
jgi:Spy/CpxP family protein refolding chaperone